MARVMNLSRQRRIVVVDDDEEHAALVRARLDRAGYETIALDSGADALAFLLHTDEPCTVLLDLQMQDMDGYEVLSTLRGSSVPHKIVIMSGMSPHQFPPGVPALRKPFTAEALLAAVEQGQPVV